MKDLFTDVGSFMVRTPSLSIDLLINSIEKNKDLTDVMLRLDSAEHQEQFEEAILVASKDLYKAMQSLKKTKEIKDEYLLNSVYKYFSRSCSRCTPFGLFSTVGFGRIESEKTTFELKQDELERHPLIDTNWLFKVVFMYETRYLTRLRYSIDESVAIYRNKALLFECTKNEDGEKINKKSINHSNAFAIVSKVAKDFVSYSVIIEELKKAYDDVDEMTFHTYLQSLIREGYLVSDLRPPLTIEGQLEYFICKLKEYNIDPGDFINIKKQIQEYCVVPREMKIECLLKIFASMESVCMSKHYLAVDSSFTYNKCNLSNSVIRKMNRFVDLFLQFNTNGSFDLLEDYKSKFIEKYGLSRCVPLVELVDNNMGIGFPQHYDRRVDRRNNSEYTNPWVTFFERKYVDAIRTNCDIEITDEDIYSLQIDNFEEDKLPKGMEIYFNYYIENGKEIFQLSDIFGSTYAGKSFGRFSHMMENSKDFFKKINRVNETEGEQFCEFTFLPDNLYSANVIRNTHGSEYETSFGTTNSKNSTERFSIKDILVGIDNNKFYLCSTNGKKIFPTATNMFNPQLKPKMLRLVDDIATDGMKFYNKPWKHLIDKFEYIPKIHYKNFILEQEKWVVRLGDVKLNKHSSFEDFKEQFRKYSVDKNIPNWVNIVEADRKLLININEDRCLFVLQKIIEKSEVILERCNVEVEHPVKVAGNSYCCELVVPLVINKEIMKNDETNKCETMQKCDENRLIEPLNDWLYFKIYVAEDDADYLLGEVLFGLLQKIIASKEIESYFFIQYRDPDFHFRLRIRADRDRLLAVQPKLLTAFGQLMRNYLISKYSIDCYELELERYGGRDLIDYAHEVFYKDSMAVQTIIHEKNRGNIHISDESLAFTIIFFHVNKFELTLDDTFDFLNCKKNNKRYQEEFKKNKEEYIEFMIAFLTNSNRPAEVKAILEILAIKDQAMGNYLNKIRTFYPDNKIIKFNILDSLLHMNMNRLFGPNVEFERKMRGLARQAFYNVFNKNKKTGFLKGTNYAEV